MWILEIILFFLLPANILFLLLAKENVKKSILLLFSFGAAPMLSGLFFYYLLWLFPEREAGFYIIATVSLWVTLFLIFFKNRPNLADIYSYFHKEIFSIRISRKKILIAVIPIFFLIIYAFQSFFYPVIGNDNALYINQSKAYAQFRNLDWEKEKSVTINGGDEYRYDNAIRPGIPSITALSFLVEKGHDYFVYKFLSFYYYVLFLIIFLYIVFALSAEFGISVHENLFFSLLFFTFSWVLSQVAILGSKESSIYFFALLSVVFVNELIKVDKRNRVLEILLGVILGLNIFINSHGIIIGSLASLLLLILSKLKLIERIKQFLLIVLASQFLSAFDAVRTFKYLFATVFTALAGKFSSFLSGSAGKNILSTNGSKNASAAPATIYEIHQDLYQIKSWKDIYLKGKLQIFTNIGVFGFYAWIFIGVFFLKIKQIKRNRFAKLIILFMLFYYIGVIDPFGINPHPAAIVLWGSAKYAALILVFSMIISVVFFGEVLENLFTFIVNHKKFFLFSTAALISFLIILRIKIIAFLLKILLSVIPIYKNQAFYQGKISIFIYAVLFFLALFFIYQVFILSKNKYKKTSFDIFIVSALSFLVLIPFLMISPGKVPLGKTFSYLELDREEKLKKTSNQEDMYKVYFRAKEILPQKTKLTVDFNDLYTYDDHFDLTNKAYSDIKYRITADECCEETVLFSSGNIKLCSKK